MPRYKARIRQKNGPRNTTVEADTEWEAVELVKGQFGIERRDIFYIQRLEEKGSSSGASSHRDYDDLDDDSDEEGWLSKAFQMVVGVCIWIGVGYTAFKWLS